MAEWVQGRERAGIASLTTMLACLAAIVLALALHLPTGVWGSLLALCNVAVAANYWAAGRSRRYVRFHVALAVVVAVLVILDLLPVVPS